MKGGTSRREGEAETYAMRHGRYVRTARSYRFPAVARGGQAHQGADATTNDADEERASRDLAPIASKKAVARGATDPYGEPQGGAKPKSDPGALSNVRSPSRADVELRNAIPRDGDQQRVSTVQVAGGVPRDLEAHAVLSDQRPDPGAGVRRNTYAPADLDRPSPLGREAEDGGATGSTNTNAVRRITESTRRHGQAALRQSSADQARVCQKNAENRSGRFSATSLRDVSA